MTSHAPTTPDRELRFSISIVSHCSGPLLPPLLADLRADLPADSEVILTLNVPEDELFLATFGDLPMRIIRNAHPKGFGANHNQAFAASRGRWLVIVNPDIRLPITPFAALHHVLQPDDIGAVAPRVLAPDGGVEDSARYFPSVARLARRVLLRQRATDYPGEETTEIDWAAGMFVLFRREAYLAIGGFDESFYMYLEDADICRRLRAARYRVLLVPAATVVHDARRSSEHNWQHLRWHLRSAVRFLIGI